MITVGNDLIRKHLHAEQKWFWLWGILLLLAGFAMLGILTVVNLAVIYCFGIVMMVGAVLQLIASLWLFKTDTRWFWALFGIFYFMAGYFTFSSPERAALAFATLLSMFMLFAGAAKMAYATFLKTMPGWHWTFASGLLTFLTGVLIMMIPGAPFWIFGLFLAADVLLQGVNFIRMAQIIQRIPPVSQTVSSDR